ncbi:MAG TPA: hypothetical protein VJB97_04560 [Candidatus Paceibacterota bacterium]
MKVHKNIIGYVGIAVLLGIILLFATGVLAAERLTASPKQGIAPLLVNFTAYIDNSEDPRYYGVNFGNGEEARIISCSRAPSFGKGNGYKKCFLEHTYSTPGDYKATLFRSNCPPNQKNCRGVIFPIDTVRVIVKGIR